MPLTPNQAIKMLADLAKELPDDWFILVDFTNDEVSVNLYDADGMQVDEAYYQGDGEPFTDAIEYAKGV